MVAFINSIVAAVGVDADRAGVALVLMAAFFAYQNWRYGSAGS